jgi:peptidyl-tRNA hydrolase
MSEGKANAQSGHAYVDALLASISHDDPVARDRAAAYSALRPGTKICLDGGSGASLLLIADRLALAGIPHALIHDQGHLEPPHFDGSEILTALGVGPLPRAACPAFLRRLPLWRGGERGRAVISP